MLGRITATLWLGLFASSAFADYAIFDNGEILESGRYKLTANTQHLTESGGMNAAARFSAGLNDEWGVRGFLGTGKTDLFFGAMAMWQPIAETDNRPAIGVNGGIHYLKDDGTREFIVRIEPMVSKRIAVGTAFFNPYASVPIGIRNRDAEAPGKDEDNVSTQIVIGSQLQVEQWKNLQFIAELGIELGDSPTYFGVGAIFYFDRENGFTLNGSEDNPAP